MNFARLFTKEVVCPDCNGTGICQANNPGPPTEPHSCCGECPRVFVEPSEVPAGFFTIGRPMIGSGKIIVKRFRWPWRRRG